MENIEFNIETIENNLQNPLISGCIVILVILFSGHLTPTMPFQMASLISNPLFKVLLIIVILVTKKYSTLGALLLTILFILSMKSASKTTSEYLSNDLQSVMQKTYEFTKNTVDTGLKDINDNVNNELKLGDHLLGNEMSSNSQSNSLSNPQSNFQNGPSPYCGHEHKYSKLQNDISLNQSISELNPINGNSSNGYGAQSLNQPIIVSSDMVKPYNKNDNETIL